MPPKPDDLVSRISRGATCVGLADEHQQILTQWLEQLLGATNPAEVQLNVAVPATFDRLVCTVSGTPPTLGSIPHDVLEATGASAMETALLTRALNELAPARVGAWLEVCAEGLDAGWWLAPHAKLDAVREVVPDSTAAGLLWDWAEEHNVSHCAELRRAVNPLTPYTEVGLALPGADYWGAVEEAAGVLGIDPFGADVVGVVEAATSEKRLLVQLLDEGITRLGIVVTGAEPSLLSRAQPLGQLDVAAANELATTTGGVLDRMEIAHTHGGLTLGLSFRLGPDAQR